MPSNKSSRPTLTTNKRIDALEEIVQGNGGAGLKGKIIVLETWQLSMKDDISEIRDSVKWATRFSLAQMVTLVIAIGMYLLGR